MNDELSASTVESSRFFQRLDWASFGITASLALAVYLFTLAPENTLEFSGVYSASAMYPGPSIPPGHPLWPIYGWIFIKLLPFSNIAWRLGVASATASALVCGLIALLVSRVGILAAESISGFKNLSAHEEKSLRVVCGVVAGLGFGFDGCLWRRTMVADPWPLSLLMFALTLALLTRWFFAPQRLGFLYAAALVLGLNLSESQALIPTAFALPFLVTLGSRGFGREIFFGIGICLWGNLALNGYLHWVGLYFPSTRHNFLWVCTMVTFLWAVLSVRTRRFFSEWTKTLLCVALFLIGISACLLLPIYSMTNPPMNWGYSRTVEGFFHVLSRGQFEKAYFTDSLNRLMTQSEIYGKVVISDYGLVYLLAATVPLYLLRKPPSRSRRWLCGIILVWLVVTLLTLIGLNPSSDKATVEIIKPFFAASHLVLAMLSGCGFMLIGTMVARSKSANSRG
jgi:Protein of unknown function (DUF2723)